jgi:endogenous inhibitor of DNA gyrase (YacG/DUF329 family)
MAKDRLCPICRRPLDESEEALRFRPFCSKRCADIDLGRWLKGAYAIPVVESDESDEVPEGEAGGDGDDEAAGEAPRIRH